MARHLTIFIILGTLTLFASCLTEQPELLCDVYAIGRKSNKITIWKNGKPETLANGYAWGAATDGTNLYVLGSIGSDGPFQILAYWKNGEQQVNLTNGYTDEFAAAITASGTDVYVAGFSRVEGAKYWKNGEAHLIAAGSSSAKGIAIVGNDIHVIGDGAKYWKNGISIELTPNPQFVSLWDILAVGSDVYICGYERETTRIVAKLWKNGVEQPLRDPVNRFGNYLSASGPNVFMGGGTTNGTGIVCWNHGLPSLIVENQAKNYYIADIAALNNTVFVVGGSYNKSGKYEGSYLWRDRLVQEPLVGDDSTIELKAVVVIPR